MVALRGLLSSNYLPAVVPNIALRGLPIFCFATFLLFWYLSKEWVEPMQTNRWLARRFSKSQLWWRDGIYVQSLENWSLLNVFRSTRVKTPKSNKIMLLATKNVDEIGGSAKWNSNFFFEISVKIKMLIKPSYTDQNAFSWRAYPVPDIFSGCSLTMP